MPVAKDEKSEIIIIIQQMILIRFENPLLLLDSMNNNIPHRIFVTMETILIANKIVITMPARAHTDWGFEKTSETIIIEPTIANNWMIPDMILIILANFLCFFASLNKRIAPHIEPAMRMMPKSMVRVEIVVKVLVVCIFFL